MTNSSPCRLWSVGTWQVSRKKIGGEGCVLLPRRPTVGRAGLEQRASLGRDHVRPHPRPFDEPRLVATRTRRPSAPTARAWSWTRRDGPAVHVWDLRTIRRRLKAMDLDWDAPPYPEADPEPPRPLPPLVVKRGDPAT